MPRPLDPRIADILKKYDEDPRDDKGVIWDCHGTWVVYHRALERVAAKAGITFSKPDVLRKERDEAVILCSGALGEREDWEIGEALIVVNYRVSGKQAAYVYAMALKRARDRLILKLVGLHGLIYSEEEADDFKQPQRTTPTVVSSGGPTEADKANAAPWISEVEACASRNDLSALFRMPEWTDAKANMTPEAQKLVQDAVAANPHYQQRAAA